MEEAIDDSLDHFSLQIVNNKLDMEELVIVVDNRLWRTGAATLARAKEILSFAVQYTEYNACDPFNLRADFD